MTCHRCGARADELTHAIVSVYPKTTTGRYWAADLCAACVENLRDAVTANDDLYKPYPVEHERGGMDIRNAPWDEDEVLALNVRQSEKTKHPYTCHCGTDLVACENGWWCDRCQQITQTWAHSSDLIGDAVTRKDAT